MPPMNLGRLTRDIEIVSRWPIGERVEEDLVTAELIAQQVTVACRPRSSSTRAAASLHIPS